MSALTGSESSVATKYDENIPQNSELTPAERFQNLAEGKELETNVSTWNPNVGKSRKPIDLTSVEAFPTLGVSKKGVAETVTWGAKNTPGGVNLEHQVSNWAPKIAGAAQQTVHELVLENKRPSSELRMPHAEILKEIQRKTGTRVDCASYKNGTTAYIILGTEENRRKARQEINKELAAKTLKTIAVLAMIRPFIIGKQGIKIQELQSKTGTNIKIPQPLPIEPASSEYEDETLINITIEGDHEGCEEAVRLIQNIVNDKVIKITRRITCPGEFHPFIQGPFSRNVEQYETEVDKVIVPDYYQTSTPPPTFSSASGPIQVYGEKKAVENIVLQIENMIAEIRNAQYTCTPVEVGIFHTQLFTRNNAQLIHEIREETSCTVIAPAQGVQVPKVYIYGPADRRGEASNAVYRKIDQFKIAALDVTKPFANAPNGAKSHARDIVRYLRKTLVVQKIENECDVDLSFPPADVLNDMNKPCNISIIGKSLEDVNKAKGLVISTFGLYGPERFAYIDVEPLHQKHIQGKENKGSKAITTQTSVKLLFPEDPEDPQIVLIYEGSVVNREDVSGALEKAKAQILEALKGQPVIVTKVLPIDREHHEKIKGDNGTTMNALNFGSIFVHFGLPNVQSGRRGLNSGEQTEDTVTLRGPPANVEATAKNIIGFLGSIKDHTPDVVTDVFEYPKQYSGNLIGQKGANINKIRDELGVEIKLSEGSGELKGVRVCVDVAKRKLFSQIKDLEDKTILVVKIPRQFHSNIIGSEGSTVRRLEERYHVRINFPKVVRGEDLCNGETQRPVLDEIVIRGTKKGAEEARQEITELWKYEAENSHTATIPATAKAVGYMFKNASKDINQLRDDHGVRVVIPLEDKNADPSQKVDIRIKGKKASVDHAKIVLSKIAANAENTTTQSVMVDKKFHRSLIGSGGQTLRNIVVASGGPDDRAALARMVRFPNQGSDSDEIMVHGNADIVHKIVEEIQKIVREKENQVTTTIQIAPEKHRKLIGREGSTRRNLESRFRVTIDIPRQRPSETASSEIKISGTEEDINRAQEHILKMVQEPEAETVDVPTHLHHAIADGAFFKDLYSKFKVSVDHNGQSKPPKPREPSFKQSTTLPLTAGGIGEDTYTWEVIDNALQETGSCYPWVLRGSPENTLKARKEIEKAIEMAKTQSCIGFMTLPDPTKYRFVVGPGGSTVDKIRKATGCRITVPRNQTLGEPIVLYGQKDGLEKVRELILDAIRK